VSVILALGPRWEPLTCYSDARWAMSRDHGPRNTRSSFGQQLLWCWSSWRSLCGAGGRDGSKVAPGASRRSDRDVEDCNAQQSETTETQSGLWVVKHS
jgi:hypothetical protein